MAKRTPRAFLDAASGPMHPSAKATLVAALEAGWADPTRLYAEARTARALLDQAREVLADGLGLRAPELSFAPDGPSALRGGLAGLAHAARRRGERVVATGIEHSSVLTRPPDQLDIVEVDQAGRVDLAAWARAVAAPGVALAVIQSANGEIGTRQPVGAALAACQESGMPLLVDAMAALGRDEPPRLAGTGWALVGDARSWSGPPGVGVLAVREGTRFLRPELSADVEYARVATQPVIPLVLAAAEAWRQTAVARAEEAAQARELIDRVRAVAGAIPDCAVVGDPDDRLPHIVTFSVLFADGEALVHELDRRGYAVASGSACTSSTFEPSHVLRALGVLTHGNIRVTLPTLAVAPARASWVERFVADLPAAVRAVRDQLGASDL